MMRYSNDSESNSKTGAQPWHRHPAARIGMWAVIGAVGGYPVGWLIAEYEDQIPALGALVSWVKLLSPLATFSGVTAIILAAAGLWMLAMQRFSDQRLRSAIDADADDNVGRLRRMLPIAGWGMLIYAAIILTFLIPAIPAALGIAIILGGFALVSWMFWRGTAMLDELEQAAQREALVAAFLIVEALGFGWAALHHYALAPPMEPVVLVTVLTLIYYFTAMVTAHRRGLAQ